MITKIAKEIFFEKDKLVDVFNDFLDGKESSFLFSQELEETFNKIKPFLEKRFVRMNNSYCFDKKITACWLGLCEDGFRYMDSIPSGTDLDSVVKQMREFYNNKNIDIPTKYELLALTNLTEAPFPICCGRPSKPHEYILYKDMGVVQGFYTSRNNGGLVNTNEGHPRPIYRLYKENSPELSDREIFILWLAHKLKPIDFEDDFYNSLLEFNFKLDDNLHVVTISGEGSVFARSDKIVEELRKVDKIRADLVEYDKRMFFDVNEGSWEVFTNSNEENFKDPIRINLDTPLVGRDPKYSIVDGIIGIDFGTKSTVVVYSKNKEKTLPMRIGIGDWSKKEESKHFENPTVMEFIDLKSFIKRYHQTEFRPLTKWEDLTVSHVAYENLKQSHSDNFNAYLTDIKQWAGDRRRVIKIEDYKKNVFEIPEFLKITDEDINPIELYAYYIGLFINNQFNGIFLEYLLSFPVTYDVEVRRKIVDSFRRGIEKSLPNIGEEIDNLRVISGVSEPSAYAAIALDKYGFTQKVDEGRVFYAVFDFGGGTTDFDFGIFRLADESKKKERRYDYVMENFGAGGDRYLGGENLLELLAFEVFKKNKDILLERGIPFILPPEASEFLGSEVLISNSREAKFNTINLANRLREFWERDSFEEEIFGGSLDVDLYTHNGELIPNISLEVNEQELYDILKNRIEKGVNSFFESLKDVFVNYKAEMDLDFNEINIFLAGNSSKSPIVKELFDKKIEEIKALDKEVNGEYAKLDYKLYLPLDNNGNFEEPNGKTGVAFGLIETRPGGSSVMVVDRNLEREHGDIRFQFYLGLNKRKKFKVVIDREVAYDQWIFFIDASEEFFEVYYTSSPLAMTNTLSINDPLIKRKRLRINEVNDELGIYIRLISPTEFEYGVGDGSEFIEVHKVELED